MAKARVRARDSPSAAESQDDELTGSPLGAALVGDPSGRDRGQVRQALEWWLEQLPAAGVELALELRAPGDALFEAFRRGRLAVYSKGYRLQEEGEEVRHYSVVLLGRCRLRCRAPAPKTAPAAAGEAPEDDEAGGIDADGCAAYDVVSKGEALGLAPFESRAPCDVHCAERTTLLLLAPDDYAATLRPYHRELQAQVVDFLQRHSVCPLGTSPQLQRLACGVRHRRLRRGSLVLRAGEPQRHVWILKSGSCSVMTDPQEELASLPEEEEESESSDESEDDVSRLERMRAQPTNAEQAQAAAAAEARRTAVSKYAKRCLSKSLQSGRQRSASRGASGGLTAAAVLSAPGLILGEEILLYEGRKQLTARCCNTIRTDEECHFYVADVTTFRQLVMYISMDTIAERVSDKFARRASQSGRNGKVAKRLEKQAQLLKRSEMRKEEHQRIRLPPSVGYKGVEVLEDVDKYLRVVFDHRKAPRNDKNPATLSVLEGLGLTPMSLNGTSSHGVGAMLRLYSDPAALKRHRAEMRWGSGMAGRRSSSASQNPMGELIPAGANYLEAAPPTRLEDEPPPPASAPPGGGGSFFPTEPDLEEREPMERSSSVPSLPRLSEAPVPEPTLLEARRSLARSSSWRGSSSSSGAGAREVTEKPRQEVTEKPRQEKAEKKAQRLAAQIMKAFQKVVPGKSILVLTDRADVRKSIMKAMLSTASEVDLIFVRTSADLWHRLRDPKEKHHALILDLSKNELQVDGLLKCCREHKRYGNIPIVVLSADRELSEVVRGNCSFVVFHPMAASMLREALVWCFDRRALLANARYETPELGSSSIGEETQGSSVSKDLEFTVTAVPASSAIAVS